MDISTEKIVAALATLGAAGQFFGLTMPAQQTREANKQNAWTAREELAEVKADRDEWIERYEEKSEWITAHLVSHSSTEWELIEENE